MVHPPKSLCTSAGTGKSTAPIYFKIPARDTQKVLIPVLPLEVGTTQLTVRLVTDLGGDEIVKDIVIEVMMAGSEQITVCRISAFRFFE